MTQWRSKHVALTIYYFNVYEITCCVIDWHVCIFYLCYNTSGWQTLNLCPLFPWFTLRFFFLLTSNVGETNKEILRLRFCGRVRWRLIRGSHRFSSWGCLLRLKHLPECTVSHSRTRFPAWSPRENRFSRLVRCMVSLFTATQGFMCTYPKSFQMGMPQKFCVCQRNFLEENKLSRLYS
jgi:hypothetical protein